MKKFAPPLNLFRACTDNEIAGNAPARPGKRVAMAEDQERGLLTASAEEISRILQNYRVVAVVGLSADPGKASHQVARYLQQHGYRIVPVNPGCQEILGEKCYPSLKDITFPVDVVDIFRKPGAIPPVVDDAIAVGAKVVWLQLGLTEPASAAKAREAGLSVVQNRCMKIEHHQRLA